VDDDALQFHWKTFPASAKQFILSTLDNLSLQKLVDFWSTHTEYTSGSVAGGIYGASWYLALVYLNRGEVSKARALTLNGCFLQECYVSSCLLAAHEFISSSLEPNICLQSTPFFQYSSLEKIAYLCTCKTIGEYDLPYFYVGFQATRSTQAMYNFLQRSMPQEYQQMLASFVNMGTKSRVMNFVNNVSNDWESPSPKSSKKSLRSSSDDEKINLIIGDDSYQVGTSTPLKSVFNEYADKNSVCLKSLRFSFGGKTLFLSTAGKKTPHELGMLDNDTIEVQSNQEPEPKEEDKPSPQKSKGSGAKKQKKGSKKSKSKSKKGCSKIEVSNSEDEHKVQHSKALTKLFEEAEPKFKLIRQELNSMNLLKQQPKTKTHSKRITPPPSFSEFNHASNGLGGKAGKTRFVVNVGEVSNLYKSSKSLNQPTAVSTIDLHGCTREEAVSRLNEGLKEWNERAMLGTYPFIHSVSIVCGGGSQILSETVEKWIGEKKNVSNAPKRSMCTSRFGAAA
jgi:DNA-nicking Smr family endonuclease